MKINYFSFAFVGAALAALFAAKAAPTIIPCPGYSVSLLGRQVSRP
ncbi:MAG: hypothetical protein LUQ52_07690 [Methylococcaceae bacterium]|nr:hypothetical protein [Methylococcaceae bacterium]